MNISRRKIIAATAIAPIATAATVIPFAAISNAAATPDPIIALYRDWKQLSKNWNDSSNLSEVEDNEFSFKEVGYRDAIGALTATSLEGLACQIHLAWVELGSIYIENSPGYFEDLKEPENALLKSILDGTKSLIPI